MYRRIAVVLAAAAALVGGLLVVAAPASAANDSLVIQNTGNGLCLQPFNGSAAPGEAIVQVRCDPNNLAQKWARTFVSADNQRFVNRSNGLCLDAAGTATNGTPVAQWFCNQISNVRWASNTGYPTVTAIRSRVSGTNSHCLDVPGASGQEGLAVQIYRCNNTSAQIWLLA